MVILLYVLPGGALGALLIGFLMLTWWFEEVSAKTRLYVLATLASAAILAVSVAALTIAVDTLGWVDIKMPYDEPEDLVLPQTSEPAPAAGPAPKLESKTERGSIEQARESHERELERFGEDAEPTAESTRDD